MKWRGEEKQRSLSRCWWSGGCRPAHPGGREGQRQLRGPGRAASRKPSAPRCQGRHSGGSSRERRRLDADRAEHSSHSLPLLRSLPQEARRAELPGTAHAPARPLPRARTVNVRPGVTAAPSPCVPEARPALLPAPASPGWAWPAPSRAAICTALARAPSFPGRRGARWVPGPGPGPPFPRRGRRDSGPSAERGLPRHRGVGMRPITARPGPDGRRGARGRGWPAGGVCLLPRPAAPRGRREEGAGAGSGAQERRSPVGRLGGLCEWRCRFPRLPRSGPRGGQAPRSPGRFSCGRAGTPWCWGWPGPWGVLWLSFGACGCAAGLHSPGCVRNG